MADMMYARSEIVKAYAVNRKLGLPPSRAMRAVRVQMAAHPVNILNVEEAETLKLAAFLAGRFVCMIELRAQRNGFWLYGELAK